MAFRSIEGDPQRFGDLFVVQVLEMAQFYDCPVVRWKFGERRMDVCFSLSLHEGFLRLRDLVAGVVLSLLVQRQKLLPLSKDIDRKVGSDPVDPRAERAVNVVRVQALKSTHQRLLGKVLGILPVPQDPVADVEDGLLIAPHQVTICLNLTLANTVDENAISGCIHFRIVLQGKAGKVAAKPVSISEIPGLTLKKTHFNAGKSP